ncbi:hypothetical protein HDU87_008397 [Geranomyces variabilis]|uniref:CCD97-like C-terminal domain-containing protein n=1 Tax=Geranomyces variabilis TaxID=109894 RepID=A0AAD5TDF6_9FUNG|nr:hypothetical protein HDU87_008397 [Geranomyces variabilis]
MNANSAAVLAAKVLAVTHPQQPSESSTQPPPAAVSAAPSEDTLTSLLIRDPALFLERYGKYLSAEDFVLFAPVAGDYETAHWIARYTKSQPPTPTQRRNRRLKYLSTPAGIAAFSIPALEARAPHALLSAHHRRKAASSSTTTTTTTTNPLQNLAAFPDSMSLVDRIYHDYDRQAAHDAAAVEEETETDSDSDSDSDSDTHDRKNHREERRDVEEQEEEQEGATKMLLLSPDASFRDAMVRRFLDGEDSGVDYVVIDADADLELLSDVGMRDAEELYFDDGEEDGDGGGGGGGGGQQRRKDYARFHESREADGEGERDVADLDY